MPNPSELERSSCDHPGIGIGCVTCLQERITELEAEREKIVQGMDSIRDAARRRNPDGATLLDFMACWNDQYQSRIAELESENKRLQADMDVYNSIINYPCTPLFEGREATQNERHLLNLLSWREREAKEAKAELATLKSSTYCAYCGHTESMDVDGSVIAQHIATCEKHPMRAVEAELARLQSYLTGQEPILKKFFYIQEDGIEVEIEHWAVRLLAASLKETLLAGRDASEVNYWQSVLHAEGFGAIEVTLRKHHGGKTPAEVAGELRAELATLRASQRARENAAARWGYVKALHRVRRHASQAIDGVEEMHLPADWTPEKGGE